MLTTNNRKELDEVSISKKNGKRKITCFCGQTFNNSIVGHLKKNHPEVWMKWVVTFGELREKGLSFYSIIKKFRTANGSFLFTSRVVERELQRLFENGELDIRIPRKEKIIEWQPRDFHIQRETLWSFKSRGSWAVHQGDYRGNWSPYIPRTLIELYSNEGDIVLDPFVGGGTTLIETWLTNRRGFGLDVNPFAVAATNFRIKEMFEKSLDDSRIKLRKEFMPIAIEGDARKLKDLLKEFQISGNSVKLILAHPPYLNSLRYTTSIQNDLSHISDPIGFCDQLQTIAKHIFELLVDDGICAILIGDVRRKNKILPLGFLVMERFLKEKFKLREIIIKTQHKDTSTRFWYNRRDKIDFLIAHEYLFIFEKRTQSSETT